MKNGIWICLIFLFVNLVTCLHGNVTTEIQKKQIVFVVPPGKKYHLSGCEELKKINRKMELKNAIQLGYEPCAICHPLNEETDR